MAATKVRVILSDRDHFSTWINLDAEAVRKYYLHRHLNMASGDMDDNFKKCVDVEILKERDKMPHYESEDY